MNKNWDQYAERIERAVEDAKKMKIKTFFGVLAACEEFAAVARMWNV